MRYAGMWGMCYSTCLGSKELVCKSGGGICNVECDILQTFSVWMWFNSNIHVICTLSKCTVFASKYPAYTCYINIQCDIMCVFSLFSFGVLDVWTLPRGEDCLNAARKVAEAPWNSHGAVRLAVSMVAQCFTHVIQRTTFFETWIVLVALLQSLTEYQVRKWVILFRPSPPEMKTHPAYLAQIF